MNTPETQPDSHMYRADSGLPPVAVIILNWNGAALLRRFLPAVTANTDPALGRVIVADNGSTDDSLRVLADEFPGVEVMAFDTNYGFAEGYNRAIAATRYPYTVLLNSDVAPEPGWLGPLYDMMQADPTIGAVQPKVLSCDEPEKFEYAGACGGYLDRNGFPYCRGRIFGTCEADRGQYDTPAEVFWASGAALMVRSDVYLNTGGLDTRFFAHMEEIDLCWRMRTAGYRVMVQPAAAIRHLGGGSLPASNPRKTYLNFRNNLLMLYKNLPQAVRGRRLLRRKLLDGVAALKFALTLSFGNVAAVWRAHRDFGRMKADYTDLPDTPADALTGCPNILVNYYLRGRKTFDRLPRH